MDRIVTRPEGLDLDSPGRRDYWVALEHDSIWGDHLIPLTVLSDPTSNPPNTCLRNLSEHVSSGHP